MLQDVEIRDLSKWGRGKVCVKRVVNVVHNGVYDLTLRIFINLLLLVFPIAHAILF